MKTPYHPWKKKKDMQSSNKANWYRDSTLLKTPWISLQKRVYLEKKINKLPLGKKNQKLALWIKVVSRIPFFLRLYFELLDLEQVIPLSPKMLLLPKQFMKYSLWYSCCYMIKKSTDPLKLYSFWGPKKNIFLFLVHW